MSMQQQLPELPYDFNELEPIISAEIMMLHYTKHHQGYVTNLNKALEQCADAVSKQNLGQMIALQSAIKFNGGGHINHSIFWTNLISPKKGGGELAKGPLNDALTARFGSKEQFIQLMTTNTVAIQGSGWGWLGYCPKAKRLEFATCENQDPLVTKGLIPLLGIDVWEHAYYLQYKNMRADYLKAIWGAINWKNVEERYLNAIKE